MESRLQRRRSDAIERNAPARKPRDPFTPMQFLYTVAVLMVPLGLFVIIGTAIHLISGDHAPRADVIEARGTVIAADPKVETIILSHGPIRELGWPSMVMTFIAPRAEISKVDPGDKVYFELNRKYPREVVDMKVAS